MIRFPCPGCGAKLKAAVEKRGASIRCPRCKERARIPHESVSPEADDNDGSVDQTPPPKTAAAPAGPIAQFMAMPQPVKLLMCGLAVLCVAGVVAGFGLRAAADPGSSMGWVEQLAFIGSGCSLVALLASLHGYGCGCPSCARWWARVEKGKDLVGTRVFFKTAGGERVFEAKNAPTPDGRRHVQATYETQLECRFCQHQWKFRTVDEYEKKATPKKRAAEKRPHEVDE